MVNKNFIDNPRYWVHTSRTYSEACRDSDYACAIYTYQNDYDHLAGPLTIAATIALLIGFALGLDCLLGAIA